jgi:hypothetical protein
MIELSDLSLYLLSYTALDVNDVFLVLSTCLSLEPRVNIGRFM